MGRRLRSNHGAAVGGEESVDLVDGLRFCEVEFFAVETKDDE